jgi:hypothetical protein
MDEPAVWRSAIRQSRSSKLTLFTLTLQPFLAVLWLHTNHIEHIALPEYYYAYNDVFGKPAGDCMFLVQRRVIDLCVSVQVNEQIAMILNDS